MAAPPAGLVPNISPAEMQILLSRAGLVLNPGQIADLVLAWRQLAGLIAGIPQGDHLADDFAFAFRLPAPGEGEGANGLGKVGKAGAARSARKASTKVSAKARAKGPRMVRDKAAGRKPVSKQAFRRR
jgi:hypothetical protein